VLDELVHAVIFCNVEFPRRTIFALHGAKPVAHAIMFSSKSAEAVEVEYGTGLHGCGVSGAFNATCIRGRRQFGLLHKCWIKLTLNLGRSLQICLVYPAVSGVSDIQAHINHTIVLESRTRRFYYWGCSQGECCIAAFI